MRDAGLVRLATRDGAAHPPVRRSGAAHAGRRRGRLRQGAARPRRRPRPRPCSTRPAPGWPRRRSASGCGCSPTTCDDEQAGHLINPVLHFPDEEEQDGDEGCLSIPGLTFDCRRRTQRRRARAEHVRRPGHASRAPRCWRAASSTRPTTSTACCSSTGSTPRPARQRCGRSARPSGPDRATPTIKLSSARIAVRLVFAGTPETAVPSLRALLDSPRHEVVAVLTRPPARAGRGRRVAVIAGGRAGASRPASRC